MPFSLSDDSDGDATNTSTTLASEGAGGEAPGASHEWTLWRDSTGRLFWWHMQTGHWEYLEGSPPPSTTVYNYQLSNHHHYYYPQPPLRNQRAAGNDFRPRGAAVPNQRQRGHSQQPRPVQPRRAAGNMIGHPMPAVPNRSQQGPLRQPRPVQPRRAAGDMFRHPVPAVQNQRQRGPLQQRRKAQPQRTAGSMFRHPGPAVQNQRQRGPLQQRREAQPQRAAGNNVGLQPSYHPVQRRQPRRPQQDTAKIPQRERGTAFKGIGSNTVRTTNTTTTRGGHGTVSLTPLATGKTTGLMRAVFRVAIGARGGS